MSIKTRLHGIAEKNKDIARYFYDRYRSGTLTREDALQRIEEIFLSQTIGVSGYIYCLNSKGVVELHPNGRVKNTDLSGFEFIRRQLEKKNGYLEYEWKNPGEERERPKALYMVYFEPLDWIISVSTYREEFYHLVDINDFRQNILSYRTGATGYAYVLAEDGTMLVHPRVQGLNLFDRTEYSNDFLKQMLQERAGKIQYFWKNPGDQKAREKFVVFKHLPEIGRAHV